MAERSLTRPLRALAEAGVDFIVVGGVAAVLNGAPVNTFDVDVVHSRDADNIGRLNLATPHGHLNLLGTIGNRLAYDDLLPHTEVMDIGEGLRVRVLDLETLIAIK